MDPLTHSPTFAISDGERGGGTFFSERGVFITVFKKLGPVRKGIFLFLELANANGTYFRYVNLIDVEKEGGGGSKAGWGRKR